MEKKQNNKNRKHKKFVNSISVLMVIVAAAIIIMNISTDDETESTDVMKNVELPEETSLTENQIAGISISDMKSTEVSNNIGSTEENSINYESTKEEGNNAESTENMSAEETAVPFVEVKEYNNVTSGKLSETNYVSDDYFENTLFLGDSRTVALQSRGFILAQNTFAVNGISHVAFLTQQFTDSITGVTGDIFSIVKERKPDKIYVALGVNGVAFIDKDTFLRRYEELIDGLMAASPESKIIIQCILPVNEQNYTGGNPNLNNKNIDEMNTELLNMAESKGIFFLDISDLIKDENNRLAEVYDSGDGLHFSFTGYSTIYDGICRHGVD